MTSCHMRAVHVKYSEKKFALAKSEVLTKRACNSKMLLFKGRQSAGTGTEGPGPRTRR